MMKHLNAVDHCNHPLREKEMESDLNAINHVNDSLGDKRTMDNLGAIMHLHHSFFDRRMRKSQERIAAAVNHLNHLLCGRRNESAEI